MQLDIVSILARSMAKHTLDRQVTSVGRVARNNKLILRLNTVNLALRVELYLYRLFPFIFRVQRSTRPQLECHIFVNFCLSLDNHLHIVIV